VELPVIAQRSASFDALSPILQSIGGRKLKLTLLVDDSAKPPAANAK